MIKLSEVLTQLTIMLAVTIRHIRGFSYIFISDSMNLAELLPIS